MNPKTMENASKIVKAGMKVLYAPETREILNKTIKAASSNDPQMLAVNAVGIIKILFDKSQGKLPPDSIPIATVLLIYEIATFTNEATGEKIPPEVLKQAIPMAMEMLKKVFAKQIEMSKKGAAPQQQPKPPMPPQGGGLINQQPQMMGA